MENHPIDSLMKNTMENIKDMVDVNTIVGNAIETKDGSTIVPISKVTFGFASGGTDFFADKDINNLSNYPFGGGTGAGISIKPVAFLVIKNECIRLLPVNQENTIDKIIDSVPQTFDMVKGLFKEDEKKEQQNEF